MSTTTELKRQLESLQAQYDAAKAAESEARAKARRKTEHAKRGITTARPVTYKGEELEQLTDGAADYIVYRRMAVVPYFVFRADGTLVTSCAFKVAALSVVNELNGLAAAARANSAATAAA